MSATDEITAAIEKLEYLRSKSTGGPWVHTDSSTTEYGFTSNVTSWMHDVAMCPGGDQEHVGIKREKRADADAELIVTLHATLDAQLAMLRDDRDVCLKNQWLPDNRILALARAINGGNA